MGSGRIPYNEIANSVGAEPTTPLRGGFFRTRPSDLDFGAQFGESLVQLGQAGQEIERKIQADFDETAGLGAFNDMTAATADDIAEMHTRQQRLAKGTTRELNDMLEKSTNRASEGLTRGARARFDQMAAGWSNSERRKMIQHEMVESKAALQTERDRARERKRIEGSTDPNDGVAQDELDDIVASTIEEAVEKGWGEDETKLMVLAETSVFHEMRAEYIAVDMGDPAGALDYVNLHGEDIEPDDRAKMIEKYTTGANTQASADAYDNIVATHATWPEREAAAQKLKEPLRTETLRRVRAARASENTNLGIEKRRRASVSRLAQDDVLYANNGELVVPTTDQQQMLWDNIGGVEDKATRDAMRTEFKSVLDGKMFPEDHARMTEIFNLPLPEFIDINPDAERLPKTQRDQIRDAQAIARGEGYIPIASEKPMMDALYSENVGPIPKKGTTKAARIYNAYITDANRALQIRANAESVSNPNFSGLSEQQKEETISEHFITASRNKTIFGFDIGLDADISVMELKQHPIKSQEFRDMTMNLVIPEDVRTYVEKRVRQRNPTFTDAEVNAKVQYLYGLSLRQGQEIPIE